MKHRDPLSLFLFLAVGISTSFTFVSLCFIIFYILFKGIPHLSFDLFSWTYTSENVSLTPAFINTLSISILSLLFAVPVGIGAAIYLAEYAKKENRFVKLINLTSETLSGIPSIVYGLFGSLFFVKFLNFGLSLLSGALTLSIIILPLIMQTSQEALNAIPDHYREGSFGLGAGKLRTVLYILLPSAMPGILSGIILSIGRIVGESAALIFTAGTVAKVASTPLDSARTLAVHMYVISGEGFHINRAYATAVILLLLVILMNRLSDFAANKLGGNVK